MKETKNIFRKHMCSILEYQLLSTLVCFIFSLL